MHKAFVEFRRIKTFNFTLFDVLLVFRDPTCDGGILNMFGLRQYYYSLN